MSASHARITLEQWRTLIAIVEAGGYAQAADRLNKSQSAVTYAVQKLEHALGVKVFEIVGRKARLTAAGTVLQRRARALVDEAARLERAAGALAAGWEAEVRIAADTVFPTWLLLECFDAFGRDHPDTRIELYETVLTGTEEALIEHRVDLAIGHRVPPGFVGEPLLDACFVAVAAPTHPLHQLGRVVGYDELRAHRQIVLRDSGRERLASSGWLGAEARWTVSHKATSLQALRMGLGFAWFPEQNIRRELAAGELVRLSLREGSERFVQLHLVLADGEAAGPATQKMAALIRAKATSCEEGSGPNGTYLTRRG